VSVFLLLEEKQKKNQNPIKEKIQETFHLFPIVFLFPSLREKEKKIKTELKKRVGKLISPF
jgi:vacuolar-type H+-ATPase subunit F/Vma7